MVYVVIFLALLAVLPVALEALRKPIDKEARGFESGEVADLRHGATFCEWHGPRSDRVIVLIHGLTTPSWVFDGLTRGLAMMGFQILTYDLYGRGWSDRPRGTQDMAFHLSQLSALLSDQEVEAPVTLMGYSMGGMIATQFAARHPEFVEALILLAPAGIDITPPRTLAFCAKAGPIGTWFWGLIGGFGLALSARGERKPASVISDYAARMRSETRKRGFLRAVLSSFRATLGGVQEQEHREIANLPIKVLAIWGENDEVIPKTAMGKLTQWNRHARHHMIAGVGHGLPHTAPNDVIGAINAFDQNY
ncbi:MAG: alpha/beta fold hydrolase [Maritimibacter sp.]